MDSTRSHLVLEPGLYAVVRGGAPLAGAADRRLRADLAAAGERSAVVPEEEAPAGAIAERGWRWLRVVGPLDLGAVGILAALAAPLAAARVPIFVISTYETDHLLVRDGDLERALAALRGAGHRVG